MRVLQAALLAVVISTAALGQEPDYTAFDAAFADFKAFMLQIEGLRIEYQTADAQRRELINEEARQLIRSAKPKVDKMVQEALKVYKAAPEADPKVAELLMSVAAHKLHGDKEGQGGDQFEAALDIAREMISGGNTTKGLPTIGAIAAFCCNEYDLVEEYSKLISERQDDASYLGDDLLGMAEDYTDPARLKQYRELWAAEKKIREAEAAADDLPRVKLETTKGDMVIELFENEAPTAVANFVSLVKDGFYDKTIFHRVLPHFMAQGGDPNGTGTGGPGYCIPCECYQDNARMHFRGSLSMAHAGRDTGGSQFFLTFVPTHHLNPNEARGTGHTVFGRVIEGIEVLGELQRVSPGEGNAVEDQIVRATVLRDRGHDYSFKKLPPR